MDRDPGEVGQDPERGHRRDGPAVLVDVIGGQLAGRGRVQPVVTAGDPGHRLVEMRHQCGGDRVLDRLVGRREGRSHPGAGGHHPAGRDLDPSQVGEDLHDSGDRDVVLRSQVGGQHCNHRPVHRRRRNAPRRHRAGPRPAARTDQQVQQMCGDSHPDLGHVEDLPHDRIIRPPRRGIEAAGGLSNPSDDGGHDEFFKVNPNRRRSSAFSARNASFSATSRTLSVSSTPIRAESSSSRVVSPTTAAASSSYDGSSPSRPDIT